MNSRRIGGWVQEEKSGIGISILDTTFKASTYFFHRFSLRLVNNSAFTTKQTRPFSEGHVREGDLHIRGDFGEGEMAAQEAESYPMPSTGDKGMYMYSLVKRIYNAF